MILDLIADVVSFVVGRFGLGLVLGGAAGVLFAERIKRALGKLAQG